MKRIFIYIDYYVGSIIAGESYIFYIGKYSTWSWGQNTYGQLGDNSITQRNTPVSILGGKKTFCQVTAGD
jgi:alpha-tubulin suppressor-like RCC1 family protein